MTALGWRMSRPISAAYLERKLRAIVGVAGSNPLPDLEDVKGLLVLETDRPEWYKAGGEELYGGVCNVPLAAANTSAAQLNNPLGSGVIVVVSRVIISHGAAGGITVKIGLTSPNLAVNVSGVRSVVDTRGRLPGTQTNGAALMFTQNTTVGDPTGGANITQTFLLANTPLQLEEPIILGPDSSLFVVNGVVNDPLIASWWWRERPIEGTFEVK